LLALGDRQVFVWSRLMNDRKAEFAKGRFWQEADLAYVFMSRRLP